MNDAAMQALGSYRGGLMLFIGLGTGLGSAIIEENVVIPLELGQVSLKNSTYENYLGVGGLKRYGKKKWQRYVADGIERMIAAFKPDDVVIGGGNMKKLKALPPGCRAGHNAFAFLGGFRLWEPAAQLAGFKQSRTKGTLAPIESKRPKSSKKSPSRARAA
jgi:polyphosphate glucokinase